MKKIVVKRPLFVGVSVVALLSVGSAYAVALDQDQKYNQRFGYTDADAVKTIGSRAGLAPGEADGAGGAGDVLSRVFLNGSWDKSSKKGQFSIETVQPLHRDDQNVFFTQGRASYFDKDWTFNVGLGYRHLLQDNSMILGVNSFWDATKDHGHRRWGVGVEAIGQVLTFRANYYGAYSGWKTVTDTATTRIEEKAMKGFDAELEGQVPFAPWMRVAAGYHNWQVSSAGQKNVSGFSGRLQMDLTSFARLEGTYNKDNYDENFSGKLTFALGEPREVEFTAVNSGFTTEQVFHRRDLQRQMLARVRRQNDIRVEKRTTNKGTGAVTFSGVSIGRSS